MTPRFTTKPWEIREAYDPPTGQKVVYGGDEDFVAALWYGETGYDEEVSSDANARLIAAAPDLYLALHAFVESYDEMHDDATIYADRITTARAALAKAE